MEQKLTIGEQVAFLVDDYERLYLATRKRVVDHLKRFPDLKLAKDTPSISRLTLNGHLLLVFRWLLLDLYASIKNLSTLDHLLTEMLIDCPASAKRGVDRVLIKGQLRVSIEVIDRHFTMDEHLVHMIHDLCI